MLAEIFIFLINISLGILLLLLATIVFDLLHVCLHRCAHSRHGLLQSLGALHTTHHQFLDTDLRIHDTLMVSNVFRHVVPEFIVQVLVTLGLAIWFPPAAVITALLIEIGVFASIMWGKPGIDINHRNIEQLKAYRPLYFCVPEYHLLHHVYPVAYFSSWIKTLDHLLGTGTALQGRRVYLTTAETGFSRALRSELQHHDAVIVEEEKSADILVLCHKALSDTDYQQRLERFYQLHCQRRIPVEVWALVSISEFDDAHQSLFADFASRIFYAEKVIYRHLVADGYASDPQLAKKLLQGIRRGFNYVPGRFGISLLKHYRQFVLK